MLISERNNDDDYGHETNSCHFSANSQQQSATFYSRLSSFVDYIQTQK